MSPEDNLHPIPYPVRISCKFSINLAEECSPLDRSDSNDVPAQPMAPALAYPSIPPLIGLPIITAIGQSIIEWKIG